MMSMAAPRRRERSLISSRIWAWMVTSSAVVGSSARTRAGLQDRAMAIIMRCRMPPLNWWGYCESRRSGSETPTSESSSTARARDWEAVMPRWISTVSVSWRPTDSTGLSDVIGSWKIMPMSLPRIRRISSSERARRSRPLKTMRPPTIRPAGAATRRITESALTDLPQPDSPTSATVSPARTSQDTPSTARTTAPEVVKWVWRSSTSRRTVIGPPFRSKTSRGGRASSPKGSSEYRSGRRPRAAAGPLRPRAHRSTVPVEDLARRQGLFAQGLIGPESITSRPPGCRTPGARRVSVSPSDPREIGRVAARRLPAGCASFSSERASVLLESACRPWAHPKPRRPDLARVNDHYLELKSSYLFSDIAKRVQAFGAANPGARLIRLGIGDVTRPLPPAVIRALHDAADELGRAETFKGYGPETGYPFLAEQIAAHDYGARGVKVAPDEIFISDGAKSDTANIQEIFAPDCVVALTDPVYPVYVDSNVMAGRAGRADQAGRYGHHVTVDVHGVHRVREGHHAIGGEDLLDIGGVALGAVADEDLVG